MTDPRKIVLVGAPRSGNRLIQTMLRRHGFLVEIRHYGSEQPFPNGGWGERAIWPIREKRYWILSCLRDRAVLPRPGDFHESFLPGGPYSIDALWSIHHNRTAAAITKHLVPCLPVSYEHIVADPENVGRRLLAFAAAPESSPKWKGWGQEVVDGNAKWQTERVVPVLGEQGVIERTACGTPCEMLVIDAELQPDVRIREA